LTLTITKKAEIILKHNTFYDERQQNDLNRRLPCLMAKISESKQIVFIKLIKIAVESKWVYH